MVADERTLQSSTSHIGSQISFAEGGSRQIMVLYSDEILLDCGLAFVICISTYRNPFNYLASSNYDLLNMAFPMQKSMSY